MNRLPEEVLKVWTAHEGPIVFSTVSAEGMPNSIYATCVGMSEDGCIVIADNYFKKQKNVLAEDWIGPLHLFLRGPPVSEGKVEYHVEGPYFDFNEVLESNRNIRPWAAVLRPDSWFHGNPAGVLTATRFSTVSGNPDVRHHDGRGCMVRQDHHRCRTRSDMFLPQL